mgnify:CR=1 FL=1
MYKKICFGGILLCFLLCFCVGCKDSLQVGVSPKLIDYTLIGECEGDESSQYVVLTLQFDQEVTYQEDFLDDLRITIANERQKGEDCQVQQDAPNCITIRMPVSAITNGQLHVEALQPEEPLAGIQQKAEGAPAYPFTIDALIPSGVELQTVDSGDSSVTKQVVGTWNIRNITWVQLWQDGALVQPKVQDSLEVLDDAVAVHGHYFLDSDEVVIAEEIAETLQDFYPDTYQFTAQDDMVIVRTSVPGKTLDLKIYGYHEFSVEGVQ